MDNSHNSLIRLEKIKNDNEDLLFQFQEELIIARNALDRKYCETQINFYKARVKELEQQIEEKREKLANIAPNFTDELLPASSRTEFDKHYNNIKGPLLKGQIVLVLGSGINLCDRPDGLKWEPGEDQRYPPTPTELASFLAERFHYPLDGFAELARVSQYAAVMEGSGQLYDQLRDILKTSYDPTSVHRFCAELSRIISKKKKQKTAQIRYPIFITTNYDNLLERALDDVDEEYDLLFYTGEENSYTHKILRLPPGANKWEWVKGGSSDNKWLQLEKRPVILKILGTMAKEDSLIITEDDFLNMARSQFFKHIPADLWADFQRLGFLFLGYNLPDWNLRVILNRFWEQRREKYTSWAIEPERQELNVNYWQKKNVKILVTELKTYIDRMQENLGEEDL